MNTMAQDMFCEICTRTFTNEGSLVKHMKLEHEEKNMYNCEQCSKSFGQGNFESSCAHSHWREATQMHTMQLFNQSCSSS